MATAGDWPRVRDAWLSCLDQVLREIDLVHTAAVDRNDTTTVTRLVESFGELPKVVTHGLREMALELHCDTERQAKYTQYICRAIATVVVRCGLLLQKGSPVTLGALLQLLPATELAPEGQCKATLSGTAMQLQRSLIGLETWARHLISLGEACTSSRFETGRQLEKRLVRHIATVITVAIERSVPSLYGFAHATSAAKELVPLARELASDEAMSRRICRTVLADQIRAFCHPAKGQVGPWEAIDAGARLHSVLIMVRIIARATWRTFL